MDNTNNNNNSNTNENNNNNFMSYYYYSADASAPPPMMAAAAAADRMLVTGRSPTSAPHVGKLGSPRGSANNNNTNSNFLNTQNALRAIMTSPMPSRTSPGHHLQSPSQHNNSINNNNNNNNNNGGNVQSKTNIFVRNLPPSVDEVTLKLLFEPFGRIVSSAIMRNIHTGESLCTAFVRFETPTEAQTAMEKTAEWRQLPRSDKSHVMHGVDVTNITTQWAKKQHDSAPSGAARHRLRKLFVRNIPKDITVEMLEELFTAFGPIKSVSVHRDTAAAAAAANISANTASFLYDERKIAFVTYDVEAAAEKAAAAVHNTFPFAACGPVPIMVKLAEDTPVRPPLHSTNSSNLNINNNKFMPLPLSATSSPQAAPLPPQSAVPPPPFKHPSDLSGYASTIVTPNYYSLPPYPGLCSPPEMLTPTPTPTTGSAAKPPHYLGYQAVYMPSAPVVLGVGATPFLPQIVSPQQQPLMNMNSGNGMEGLMYATTDMLGGGAWQSPAAAVMAMPPAYTCNAPQLPELEPYNNNNNNAAAAHAATIVDNSNNNILTSVRSEHLTIAPPPQTGNNDGNNTMFASAIPREVSADYASRETDPSFGVDDVMLLLSAVQDYKEDE